MNLKTCNDLIEKRKQIWEQYKDVEKDKRFNKYCYGLMTGEEGKDQAKLLVGEIDRQPWMMIELFFRLRDKKLNLVPFFLNEAQRYFQDNFIVEAYEKQRTGIIEQIKIIILKGRQLGFTSYTTALQESLMITCKGFRGFTMAHDTESTQTIFEDKAKSLYNDLIDELKDEVKRSNSKELVLKNMDSAWRCATAGSGNSGRGKTIGFLHNSEKAFWKDIKANAKAVSEALTKNSIEIDETTANGYNDFKELWDEAVRGENNYKPCFIVWWLSSEYRVRFDNDRYTREEFETAIDKGERFKGVDSQFMIKLRHLRDYNNLDIEQLHFYYKKRVDLKDAVSQEYPCTPEEAFLHSGRPYFDIELIDVQLSQLSDDYEESLRGGDIVVYEKSVSGHRYVIGSDVAEGLEGKDDSSFFILDINTMREVARGIYTMKPDDHGRELDKWSERYNNAMISVERNNHGHSTINTLCNECYAQSRLYEHTTLDKINDTYNKKYGWETNGKTKYIGLDKFDSMHRENKIIIRSKELLKEMRECQNEDGKVNTNGKDILMAAMIAVNSIDQAMYKSGTGQSSNGRNLAGML